MRQRIELPDRSTKALSVFWVVAGTLHFVNPHWYLRIMPPWLPAPYELVLASGVAEAAGGLAVAVPAWRRWAGWWLIATTLAVYPANVHMALNPDDYDVPAALLWLRLPLQFALLYWIWRVALRARG
jgi:uncharacterized membrane protein